MTAPAKAAPMRDDVTPLIEMLRAATAEEGCTVFEHSPEEIGLAAMEAHNEILARLAHTARPDAGDAPFVAWRTSGIPLGEPIDVREFDGTVTRIQSGSPLFETAIRHIGMDMPVRRAGLSRPDAGDGYATAFYEIAAMLGIGAQAASPADVWRDQMRPKLEALTARPDAGDEDVERDLSARKTINTIIAGLIGPLVPDFAERVRLGNEATTAIIAAMREGVDRGMVERLREALVKTKQAARYVAVGDGYFDPYASHVEAVDAIVDAALEQPR